MSNFFSALEAQDYGKAFAIYTNDPEWQQHPEKHAGLSVEAIYGGLDDRESRWRTDSVAPTSIFQRRMGQERSGAV